MKIKKKLVETKDKVKVWFEEHKPEIIVAGLAGIGMVGSCIFGQSIGYSDGFVDGVSDTMKILCGEEDEKGYGVWQVEPNQDSQAKGIQKTWYYVMDSEDKARMDEYNGVGQ